MKLLIHTAYDLSPADRQNLASVWPDLEISKPCIDSLDDLDGSDVSILVTEQVPRNLAAWPHLSWVQLLSAGANQLLHHPIGQTAIPVTTASGTHGVPIAQFVTCSWLNMIHHMPQLFELKSSRKWPDRRAIPGTSVRGLTAGIIGYGSIGRECARQLSALGMRIVCLKRDPAQRSHVGYNAWPGTGDPDAEIPERWFAPTQLDEMLPECDLLVVTAAMTLQTNGMIGKAELTFLKRTARIIIVSRGGIVVEKDLAEALRAGQLKEAVVDCFVQEPIPPDHFFFDVPNLILTPHISGVYDGFWMKMVGLLCENLRRFKAGLPLLNQTNT